MIQLGRVKIPQPANDDVASLFVNDSACRAALGKLAGDQTATTQHRAAAAAATALSRQASTLIPPGQHAGVVDNSIAIMFIPDAPITTTSTRDELMAAATAVSIWQLRFNGGKWLFYALFPAKLPDGIPIAFEINPEATAWTGISARTSLLTASGASALSSIRNFIPKMCRVWKNGNSDEPWTSVYFHDAVAEDDPDDVPDSHDHGRQSNDSQSVDYQSSPTIAVQDRTSQDAATFALVIPAFEPTALAERTLSSKGPNESFAAIVNRFHRYLDDMRINLSEKQVKAWILADFHRQGSSLNLSSLALNKGAMTLEDLTYAVAALIEGEIFLRGTHMRVIGDAYFVLVRIAAKQRDFGPASIARMIEKRMSILREPAPKSGFEHAARDDEWVARAQAAFTIEATSPDLVDMQRYPIPEVALKRPRSPTVSDKVAPKRTRLDKKPTRNLDAPDRFRKFENVCYAWAADAARGTACRRRGCVWKHVFPTTATPPEIEEFRRWLVSTDAERNAF